MKVMNICICGGGSTAHAVAGVLGAHVKNTVNILTRRPADWGHRMQVDLPDESVLFGRLNKISDLAEDVVKNCDLVILAVPHYARRDVLTRIQPFLKAGCWVGCLPGFAGFAWEAYSILGPGFNLFGMQRVPFVRNGKVYGKSVTVMGIRPRNIVASVPARKVNEIADILRERMNLYVVPAPNYLNICFSRSNSIYHPARMFSLLRTWDGRSIIAKHKLKFYGDWDEGATRAFLALDKEVSEAAKRIPLDTGYAQPVLQLYEVAFPEDLAGRMRSIRAMRKNYIRLIKTERGFLPDLESYFFTEDIASGLLVLKGILQLTGAETPYLDEVIRWGEKLLNKNFLEGSRLAGKDIENVALPQRYGINTLDDLVRFCSL